MKSLPVFRSFAWSFAAFFCLAALPARAASIEIATIPGTMKFNPDTFEVRAGEAVELVFTNNCLMPHNLLIGRPGSVEQIVTEAMALGAEGLVKHFVPDSTNVLHATKVIDPGMAETLKFNAPSAPGQYPYVCTFPGHGILMRGVMTVHAAEQIATPPLAGTTPQRRREIAVVDTFQDVTYGPQPLGTPEKPLVVHTFMPNPGLGAEVFANHERGHSASNYDPSRGRDNPGVVDPIAGIPAAVGVSFGPDFSYCWDTTECRLLYAWNQGFLDFENYWGRGAGGGRRSFDYVPRLVGRVFFKAVGSHPFGGSETAPKYLGYHIEQNIPVFSYQIGNTKIHEKVTPAGNNSLRIEYRIEGGPPKTAMKFDLAVRPMIQNEQGRWEGNSLILEGADARQFALRIRR